MKDRLARSHETQVSDTRRLGWALAITTGFMAIEVVGGLVSGSLALLADAGHMVTDAGALALAWLAARLMLRPASPRRSYGYHRAQVLAAFVNALALLVIAAWIVVEATQRLLAPPQVAGATMLGVALAGLAANLAVYATLRDGSQGNLNVTAARLHVLSDLLGSIGAIVAAGVILATGWTPIDPLLSVLVAGLILRSAWRLLQQSTRILMEASPESVDPDALRAALVGAVPHVHDVHDIHCWSLTTGQTMLTLHMRLERGADASAALQEAKRVLAARFDIAHSALQLEFGPCPDEA